MLNLNRLGKKAYLYVLPLFVIFFINTTVFAGFGDFLNKAQQALSPDKKEDGQTSGHSENQIVEGLKEALKIGTEKAVNIVGQMDGYYKNPKVKIPLPESVRKIEKFVKKAGYDSLVDDFELSMNRAAEKAAPQAKAIFWDATKKMTVTDGKKILEGKDDAATTYFKGKTSAQLKEIFKPIVHETMGEVGVTKAYQALNDKVKTIPFANMASFDLDDYVTDKSLDGLFLLLAEEEKKIREDPAARVTDILKNIFK